MSIVRAPRPAGNFTIIPNAALRDSRLSYRARGVLAAILSHQDNWQTTAAEMAGKGAEGRDAIRSCFAELEHAGYMRRVRHQGPGGRWSNDVYVFDDPTPVDNLETPSHTGNGFSGPGDSASPVKPLVAPKTDFPAPVEPAPEKPAPESQALIEEQLRRTNTGGQPTSPGGATSASSPSEDPQNELGGQRRADDAPYRPRLDRCVKHQYDRHPPPCGRCKEARETHAEETRAAAHAKAVAERDRAEDEARTRWAAITNCNLCDDRGYTAAGQICNHDPDAPERSRRGITRARKSISRKDQS